MERQEYIIICSYTYSFHDYAKWLYLNGIEYELRESRFHYNDNLEIIIFRPKEKAKRRWLNEVFMRNVFPKLRDKHYIIYNKPVCLLSE